MKGPKGTTTAVIEGHTYNVDKKGVIKLVSPTHIETLKRHGFEPHYEKVTDDQIDKMEDKAALVELIEEHGGSADEEMTLKKLRRLAKEAVANSGE